jgi:MFS family permease
VAKTHPRHIPSTRARPRRPGHERVRRVARAAATLPVGFASRLLNPLRMMRWRYVPLLMVYFASGAAALSGVAETFFVKDRLSLSAEMLVTILVWVQVPWSIKPVFGQLVDSVPLFGSRRRVYVFLGAGLIATGYVMLVGIAGGWLTVASPEALYIAASLITVIGTVLQDSVADAMSTEVVRRSTRHGRRRSDEVNVELGEVQVLGRIAFSGGAFAVAGLAGWVAQILTYEQVFLLALVVPAISISGALFVRIEVGEAKPLDRRIFFGGLGFIAVTVAVVAFGLPYAQETMFILSLGIILVLIRFTLADLDAKTRRNVLYAAFLIFVFRAMPAYGPGAQWWQIDVLGFDPAFFGTLGQWSAAIGILGTWLFSHAVNHRPIPVVLFWLTVIGPMLSFPTIGMYYGLHEWTQEHFGFGARTIAIVDASITSPFVQLSAIPMLTLIAVHAPPGRRATWFALMASLMNLALQAGGIATKYLNKAFVVERGGYEHLGSLMIVVTAIALAVPLLAIGLVSSRIKLGAAVNTRAKHE